MHEIWPVVIRNHNNYCHQMSNFKAKIHQILFLASVRLHVRRSLTHIVIFLRTNRKPPQTNKRGGPASDNCSRQRACVCVWRCSDVMSSDAGQWRNRLHGDRRNAATAADCLRPPVAHCPNEIDSNRCYGPTRRRLSPVSRSL